MVRIPDFSHPNASSVSGLKNRCLEKLRDPSSSHLGSIRNLLGSKLSLRLQKWGRLVSIAR